MPPTQSGTKDQHQHIRHYFMLRYDKPDGWSPLVRLLPGACKLYAAVHDGRVSHLFLTSEASPRLLMLEKEAFVFSLAQHAVLMVVPTPLYVQHPRKERLLISAAHSHAAINSRRSHSSTCRVLRTWFESKAVGLREVTLTTTT